MLLKLDRWGNVFFVVVVDLRIEIFMDAKERVADYFSWVSMRGRKFDAAAAD